MKNSERMLCACTHEKVCTVCEEATKLQTFIYGQRFPSVTLPLNEYEHLLSCLSVIKDLTELPPRLQQEQQEMIEKTYTEHMKRLLQLKQPSVSERKTYYMAKDLFQLRLIFPDAEPEQHISDFNKLRGRDNFDLILCGGYVFNEAFKNPAFPMLQYKKNVKVSVYIAGNYIPYHFTH